MRTFVFVTVALLVVGVVGSHLRAQRGPQPDEVRVRAIEAPAHPLPPDTETSRVSKFAFFVYGDTRSVGQSASGEPAPDGLEIQRSHSAVVDAMMERLPTLAGSQFPVRFVVSTGDAVLYGPNGAMWNVSYVPVIERLTRQAGLPLFFAPGNHDVTIRPAGDPEREHGVRNILSAMANL